MSRENYPLQENQNLSEVSVKLEKQDFFCRDCCRQSLNECCDDCRQEERKFKISSNVKRTLVGATLGSISGFLILGVDVTFPQIAILTCLGTTIFETCHRAFCSLF